MCTFRFIACLWLGLIAVLAAEETEDITVRLPTQTRLLPLYLADLSSHDTEFSTDYLAQLEEVLAFDLAHNGTTQLAAHTPERKALTAKTADLDAWKQEGVLYVVLPRVEANHLSVRFLNLANGSQHELDDITLSGSLAKDRRSVHRVADALHQALFGQPGIARTRLLFTKRVFDTSSSKYLSEIWEADYDGGNARQVTSEGAYCVTPIFLSAEAGKRSQQFLYVSYKTGQPKIMHASLANGHGQRVTSLRGNQLLPAASPQRDRIAFICDVAGNADLFVQPFDLHTGVTGKPQQIFSLKRSTQGSPSFSPNGERIAFVSNKAGPAKIYVMDVPPPGAKIKDLSPTLISVKARNGTAPCWSPDGSKIAFCSRTHGVRQIWMYDCETGQEYQLTRGPGHKENPSWAPNSLHLVYNSANPDDAELFLLDLHSLKPVQLQLGDGEKHYPSWGI